MNHPDENPLLKGILADEKLVALREVSLQRGLAAMRRGRRLDRAARVGLLVLVPALLIVALRKPIPGQVNPSVAPHPQSVAAAPLETGSRMISDEELFALFPRRSLALIGKPGQQQLVDLDASITR